MDKRLDEIRTIREKCANIGDDNIFGKGRGTFVPRGWRDLGMIHLGKSALF